jgi:hypothetical protein
LPDPKFPTLSDLTRTTSELEGWGGLKPKFEKSGLQWLRKINLTVYSSVKGGDKKDGIELSQLRIDFRLTKQTNATPNFLQVKVYNMAPETIQKVGQHKRIQLSAGYQANFGMIFDGEVALYIIGKENPVDSYLEIIAGDQPTQNQNVTLDLSFPPNTTPEQQVKAGLEQAKIPTGQIDLGKGQQKTLRYTHYLGPLPQFMRNHTNATASQWYIDDGKAYVIPITGYLKGEIVDLSPTTGLVGIPKVSPDGIEAICLLNPKLRISGLVHIDSKLLSNVAFTPGGTPYFTPGVPHPLIPTGSAFTRGAASVSPTGVYKILLLNHYGDTRGNPWYSEVICAASGADGELLLNSSSGTALERSTSRRKATEDNQPGLPAGATT